MRCLFAASAVLLIQQLGCPVASDKYFMEVGFRKIPTSSKCFRGETTQTFSCSSRFVKVTYAIVYVLREEKL